MVVQGQVLLCAHARARKHAQHVRAHIHMQTHHYIMYAAVPLDVGVFPVQNSKQLDNVDRRL